MINNSTLIQSTQFGQKTLLNLIESNANHQNSAKGLKQSPANDVREQKRSKYGLRDLKTSDSTTNINSILKRQSSTKTTMTADKCVQKKRTTKLITKNAAMTKSTELQQSEFMLQDQDTKNSSIIETNQEVYQLDSKDRLSMNNVSLGLEVSKYSYLIQGHSQKSVMYDQNTQDLSINQTQALQTPRKTIDPKLLGKREFPSFNSFIQRRQQQQYVKDKHPRCQNDIASSGHNDSNMKTFLQIHQMQPQNIDDSLIPSQLLVSSSPKEDASQTKKEMANSNILAFKKILSLNQKIWPAQSTCNLELVKCNSLLKGWTASNQKIIQKMTSSHLEKKVGDQKVDTNLKKSFNFNLDDSTDQSPITYSTNDIASSITTMDTSTACQQEESMKNPISPPMIDDMLKLHNEYARQEEAMMNFLNSMIAERKPSGQFMDIYGEFVQNQIKLRQILQTLIQDQQKLQTENQSRNIDCSLDNQAVNLSSASIAMQSLSPTESAPNSNLFTREQEGEMSNGTQGTAATNFSQSINDPQRHTFQNSNDQQYSQNQDNQDQAPNDVNDQAQALVGILGQMMESINTGSAESKCATIDNISAKDQLMLQTMKQTISSLQNKIY